MHPDLFIARVQLQSSAMMTGHWQPPSLGLAALIRQGLEGRGIELEKEEETVA